MNRAAIAAIVRKDLATVVRNRGVRIPLLVTPVVILVLLPILLVVGGEALVGGSPAFIADLDGGVVGSIADESVQERLTGEQRGAGRWAVFVLEVFLAPLFLLVPLIVATVIAADSFAGERERGTLEALLHTPTTDRELLTAKFLAAWIPAIVITFFGFAVYSVLANVLAWPSLGRVFFPTPTWLLLAFWVTPGIAALGLSVMVVASSRVRSLQAAHQIGSLVVLPILLLLIAQVTGVLLFGPRMVTVFGVMIWAAALFMLTYGASSLRRQKLALRL
jgi:ABC-2 type transport system permease protein